MSFEQHAIADFTRPWASRRGLEPSDQGLDALLVRAAPADVTAALVGHGMRADRDALGKEITVARSSMIVVRLRGHTWSAVLHSESCSPPRSPAQLSSDLGAQVITVASWEDDIEYKCFEQGKRIEHVTGDVGTIETFVSKLRTRDAFKDDGAEDATSALLKERDAYACDLSFEYFFSDGRDLPQLATGSKHRVKNPGFILVVSSGEVVSVPEIEMLDYLVLPA